jgi:hypothetical protein
MSGCLDTSTLEVDIGASTHVSDIVWLCLEDNDLYLATNNVKYITFSEYAKSYVIKRHCDDDLAYHYGNVVSKFHM